MGKILLLTGGNSGIGYFMVKEWLDQGNAAAVLDLECSHLDVLRASHPRTLATFVCDVTDGVAVGKAAAQVEKRFGRIDIAVHNACVCLFRSFDEHALGDFGRVMDVNFMGAVAMASAVIPGMLARKAGKVCFTSSGVGVTGFAGISSYAASKGAIEAFAKCMRLEYLGTGVSFHILHPPLTDTKSSSPLPVPREFKALPEKVGRGLARRLGSKRFVVASSFGAAASIWVSYLFPLKVGEFLTRMTTRSANSSQKSR